MNSKLRHEAASRDQLCWTMTRTVQDGNEAREESWRFDLTELTTGYSLPLLLAIKAALIERRHLVAPVTIQKEYIELRVLLRRCQHAEIMSTTVAQIDLPFLAALETIKEDHSRDSLRTLRRFFELYGSEAKIFASDLRIADFPEKPVGVGLRGEAIKRILSQALSRAALVEVLTTVEEAYEAQRLDIGHYAFSMLAFQVYFRPASYRKLRLMDLIPDKNESTGHVNWFVNMVPAKTRVDNPHRVAIKITSDLGEVLKLQQAEVVRRYGHLVADTQVEKLALFPLLRITEIARRDLGMYSRGGAFALAYLGPIEKLVRKKLTFNALRHTVGTQLALTGLSASRISAVLMHADDETCQQYVDLFFQGTLDLISDAMQPAFDKHFPVYQAVMERTIRTRDQIPKEKAIVSEDLETGRREVTAECGRETLCGYAPLACYDCNKFRPCWDADHTINLDVVSREISEFEGQGLAMQHEAQKFKRLRNAIKVVIRICELKAQAAG